MTIEFIGWGDTSTRPNFAVSNAQALEMIRSNLRRRIAESEKTNIVPDQKLVDELTKLELRTPEEVAEKIGVESRQYAVDKTSTELAIEAAENAVDRARKNDPTFDVSKIKLVISGGSTPDDLYPACAARVQDHFKLTETEAFDVSLACCSGTQGFITAVRAMRADGIRYALLTTGEKVGSPCCNELIDESGTLWGDGGGAAVIRLLDNGTEQGLIAYQSRIDGSLAYTTRSCGIGAHPDHRIMPVDPSMQGHSRMIQKWVRRDVARDLKQFVESRELDVANNNRAFAFFHNGNRTMIEGVAEEIGIPPERVLHRIKDRGNQSSASVFSSLAFHADVKGALRSGDLLIFATFGGGVAYNFLAYRW